MEYGLNLYFQFAGYSDIAIGMGLTFGYTICENFSNPFLKPNIISFWRSWHISLADWIRDYVYLTLVAHARNRAFAIVVAMIALGLWHEFTFRYIVWGAYHGAGIAVYHRIRKTTGTIFHFPERPVFRYLSYALAVMINFTFVSLSFALTKEDTILEAMMVYREIFLFWI